MAISAVAGVLAQVQASARTMAFNAYFTSIYRESSDDEWQYAQILLDGWVPGEVFSAELVLQRSVNVGDWPDPPSGNGGYWLLGVEDDQNVITWEWASTLDSIPDRITTYGYIELVRVTEALNWFQKGTVAGQPSPDARMLPPRPHRPPVSEVKGLRKPSWRRWLSI